MIASSSYLDHLKQAADGAADAENEFRRSIVERTKALEQERSFAFRRLNLMRTVADVVAGAESEEIAVASAVAVLREKLGWSSDSDARSEVLSRFAPVAQEMFTVLSPPEGEEEKPDVLGTLAAFEDWYAQTHPVPFFALFDHYIPETPRVDF